ncbi:MAG: methyltransferase domain-containing protein, partial [Thioalkalispiraceae bacterium]
MADRNFDDLLTRFNKNIYQSAKGQIRLHMLEADLHEVVPLLDQDDRYSILDAGAGTGEFARRLVKPATELVLCDISANMLEQARETFLQAYPAMSVSFVQSPIDQLAEKLDRKFDLVLCHAVLEWLEDPRAALRQLVSLVEPGGYLSLMFFNKNSLIMRQMLNGNLKKLKSGDFRDKKTTLTPISPLEPEMVYQWLEAEGLAILRKTGIRVMYDYMAG